MKKKKIRKIFKINFIDADYDTIKNLLDRGGLLVVPSGPGLATIGTNAAHYYYKALKNADIAIFDSGYLCLLLRILKNIRVERFSGLIFIKKFILDLKKDYKNSIFLINPSHQESRINNKYLKSKNIKRIHHYVAPMYNKKKIIDLKLLNRINKIRPKYILINLGGGVQEILGYYLKRNLNYKPSIICTGAAIAFLTKKQAPIPVFIDKVYLGWLVRIIFNPRIFLPRYLLAFKLLFLVKNEKINKIN